MSRDLMYPPTEEEQREFKRGMLSSIDMVNDLFEGEGIDMKFSMDIPDGVGKIKLSMASKGVFFKKNKKEIKKNKKDDWSKLVSKIKEKHGM